MLQRPLLGHFNYSRAGCNWSRLRGISLSMKMSRDVNTARANVSTFVPHALTSGGAHHSGGEGETWRQADVARTRRGGCLSAIKRLNQPRRAARHSSRRLGFFLFVFCVVCLLSACLPPHPHHLTCPLTEHFLQGSVLSPTNFKFS